MTPHLKTDRLRLYAPYHRVPDVESHVRWLNTPAVVKYSEQRHQPHNQKTQWEYIRSFNHVTTHFWELSRLTRTNYDMPIGTMTAHVDFINGVADVGILIGDHYSSWGHGYGTEAWAAVCQWLFSDGVRKIEAGTLSENKGMLSIFKKTGMEIEGTRKSRFVLDGKPVDMVMAGRLS